MENVGIYTRYNEIFRPWSNPLNEMFAISHRIDFPSFLLRFFLNHRDLKEGGAIS